MPFQTCNSTFTIGFVWKLEFVRTTVQVSIRDLGFRVRPPGTPWDIWGGGGGTFASFPIQQTVAYPKAFEERVITFKTTQARRMLVQKPGRMYLHKWVTSRMRAAVLCSDDYQCAGISRVSQTDP